MSTVSDTYDDSDFSSAASTSSSYSMQVLKEAMDLSKVQCGLQEGAGRVVMVRKTEQRTFASTRTGREPKFETVTRETVETFSGGKSQRRITTIEKTDVVDDEDLKEILGEEARLNGAKSPLEGMKSKSVSNGTSKQHMTKQGESKLSLLRPKTKCDHSGEGDAETEENAFEEECLKAHNEYRQRHGVPPLKLNKKLCKFSEEWAKRIAARNHIEHRDKCEYGENIFHSWSTNPNYKITGREPVDHWYSEIKYHPFGQEPTNLKSGHFSQVVWKDSQELGVAVAKSRKGQMFVVANYYPPGNYIGSYTENVPPLGGFSNASYKSRSSESNYSSDSERDLKSPVGSCCEDEEFAKEGLRIHNEYRRRHGTPELKLSPALCEYAKQWAKTLAREESIRHRPNGKYGENLFSILTSNTNWKVIAQESCDTWYKEIKDHVFGTEPKHLKSGHFSQMVWKGSHELGMSMAKSKTGRIIVVANYNPRGNYIGSFHNNVLPKTA